MIGIRVMFVVCPPRRTMVRQVAYHPTREGIRCALCVTKKCQDIAS